jgi:hypothetical protein
MGVIERRQMIDLRLHVEAEADAAEYVFPL